MLPTSRCRWLLLTPCSRWAAWGTEVRVRAGCGRHDPNWLRLSVRPGQGTATPPFPGPSLPLQLAADACSNLLYNVSPADSATHGRRPAYLFELLRRPAAEAGGWAAGAALGSRLAAELCSQLAATDPESGAEGSRAAICGTSAGASSSPCVAATLVGLSRDAVAQLRAAVSGSPHVAKLLRMWASVQVSAVGEVRKDCGKGDRRGKSRPPAAARACRRRHPCWPLLGLLSRCTVCSPWATAAAAPSPSASLLPADAAAARLLPGALPGRATGRPRAAVCAGRAPALCLPCPGWPLLGPGPQPVGRGGAPACTASRVQRRCGRLNAASTSASTAHPHALP